MRNEWLHSKDLEVLNAWILRGMFMFISFCCDPASFLVQGLQMGEFSYNSPRLNAHLCEAFIKIFMKKQFRMELAQNELV